MMASSFDKNDEMMDVSPCKNNAAADTSTSETEVFVEQNPCFTPSSPHARTEHIPSPPAAAAIHQSMNMAPRDLMDMSISNIDNMNDHAFTPSQNFNGTNLAVPPVPNRHHRRTSSLLSVGQEAPPSPPDDAIRQAPSLSPSNDNSVEETDEQRRQREEEESIRLAQMLMAEEAMASHRASADFLRMNSGQFSQEDYAALQNALAEEEHDEEPEEEQEEIDEDLSYEAMLNLGERIGDVKSERWAMVARNEIAKLPTFQYQPATCQHQQASSDDSEIKCLVCQFHYEKEETLRRLPCGHCFHSECIDQWLLTKDICAYCRQPIVNDNNNDNTNNNVITNNNNSDGGQN